MILAVLLVLLALVVADRLLARQEMGNLLDHVEVSESAMKDSLAANRQEAARLPAHPTSEDFSKVVTPLCAKAAAAVAETGVAVGDVAVLPWHANIARARDRYVTHSRAWEDHLTACARDALKIADEADDAKIRSTFAVAHTAFDAAIPWPSSPEQEARTTAIFTS
jgi:hypothetical protein